MLSNDLYVLHDAFNFLNFYSCCFIFVIFTSCVGIALYTFSVILYQLFSIVENLTKDWFITWTCQLCMTILLSVMHGALCHFIYLYHQVSFWVVAASKSHLWIQLFCLNWIQSTTTTWEALTMWVHVKWITGSSLCFQR